MRRTFSQPFRQSLEAVRRHLDPERWGQEPIGVRPMTFVPMSATLEDKVASTDVIQIDGADRASDSLARRLGAAKMASLHRVADLPKAIAERSARAAKAGHVAVGIIINRVATAKSVYDRLREQHPDAVVELVIGSMRPIDRDLQSGRLAALVGRDRPAVSEMTSFVVATQCLEVGADYDFDVLITECASLDALLQRFGRLNRAGRAIDANAMIVIKDKDARDEDLLDDDKPYDPIYGNASARTWNWLLAHATVTPVPEEPVGDETAGKKMKGKSKPVAETRVVDFGIDAFDRLLGEPKRIPEELLAPSATLDAPVMLPAYVDSWCQTSPTPVPEPDVSLFIHGKRVGEPDVQVCWRHRPDRRRKNEPRAVVRRRGAPAAHCCGVHECSDFACPSLDHWQHQSSPGRRRSSGRTTGARSESGRPRP